VSKSIPIRRNASRPCVGPMTVTSPRPWAEHLFVLNLLLMRLGQRVGPDAAGTALGGEAFEFGVRKHVHPGMPDPASQITFSRRDKTSSRPDIAHFDRANGPNLGADRAPSFVGGSGSILVALPSAHAHEWYPLECCANHACAPADPVVRRDDDTYLITSRGMSVVIPPAYRHWRVSPDGQFHVCLRQLRSGGVILICAFRGLGA
jgi:hypothetical protein